MLEERGIVVETDDHLALIQTQHTTHCHGCAANQSCGTASLAAILGRKDNLVTVVNQLKTKRGDKVVIGLEEQAFLKMAIVLYLLPLLGLFIGAISYESLIRMVQWPHYDILTALAGLLGFWIGLKWTQWITIQLSKQTRYQPVILKTE